MLKEHQEAYEHAFMNYLEGMRYVRDRVLDVGCGAGRHALYLQNKGFDVTGIDISSLAIKVCKLRGLKKAEVLSITQINSKPGKFNTILMAGNNFGLLENPKRANHKWNRERGRPAGRIRIRYKKYVTPWFDYLSVSKEELREIKDGNHLDT